MTLPYKIHQPFMTIARRGAIAAVSSILLQWTRWDLEPSLW